MLQLAAEAPTDAGVAAPVAAGTRTPPYDLLLQSDSRDATTPCEVAQADGSVARLPGRAVRIAAVVDGVVAVCAVV